MGTFKTKAFTRFADKAGISDVALCRAVTDAERGLVAADLSGGVIKQRIARSGQGKSGGFRTLIVFRAGTRAIFVHGFAKSERDNIEKDELVALKNSRPDYWPTMGRRSRESLHREVLSEVKCDDNTYRSALMASIHETVEGLHAAGVMDKRTMRENCFPSSQRTGSKRLRDGPAMHPNGLSDPLRELLAWDRSFGNQP